MKKTKLRVEPSWLHLMATAIPLGHAANRKNIANCDSKRCPRYGIALQISVLDLSYRLVVGYHDGGTA